MRYVILQTLLLAVLDGHSLSMLAIGGEYRNPFLPEGIEDEGWPSVRGPGFDAHSKEIHLAEQWPEAGPPVLWVRELGQGFSGFAACGERVYTQAQSLGGQYVYCLDADTGKTLWKYRYDAPYELVGMYPGPRATPTVYRGRVYFAAPDGLIGCLTSDAGKLIWSKNVLELYKGKGGVNFGYSCSPTAIDEMVILPVGGPGASMVALDAADGTKIWTSGSDPASYASAYPVELDGRALVVGYLENTLIVCDRLSGKLLARMDISYGYDEHAAWPIYSEPYLWFSAPFHTGSHLIDLSPLSESGAVESVWRSETMSNDVSSSILLDGYLYGFDLFEVQAKVHRPSRGKFRCIEMLSGEISWSQGSGRPRRDSTRDESEEPEIGQTGIVVADGKLLLLNELGELILLRATPEECETLARATVLGGELTWTPPALHRGRVYIRNHSRAVCVYVGEPDLLENIENTLSPDDVPQTEYRDLAGLILAIEPEYAFDIPSRDWLWNWYLVTLAMLLISELCGLCFGSVCRHSPRNEVGPWISRIVAFLGGGLGTTFLSGWTGEFLFTWPLCLYVAFEATLACKSNRGKIGANVWKALIGRLPLLAFVGLCFCYFLLCRRLSLLFEWTFLAGFVGALPLLYRLPSNLIGKGLPRLFVSVASYSCFYAVGVVVLVMKYH